MEALKRKRDAAKQQAARVFGTRFESPRVLAGQLIANSRHSDIVALPAKVVSSPQNLDSASGDFGTFFFMMGYDSLGSAKLGG